MSGDVERVALAYIDALPPDDFGTALQWSDWTPRQQGFIMTGIAAAMRETLLIAAEALREQIANQVAWEQPSAEEIISWLTTRAGEQP